MFYDEAQAIIACEEDPSLVFKLIEEGHYHVIDQILSKDIIDLNTIDEAYNSILMRLLKASEYDLVLKHMKNKKWDVNHQNNEKNTFAHLLMQDRGIKTLEIIKTLKKNKDYDANLKNNKGETILDKAIESNYITNAMNILADKRFNNIGLASFNDLYHTYIKSNDFGKYSKLNTLELVVSSLENKELIPQMKSLLNKIKANFDLIKAEFISGKSYILDNILDESISSLS